MLKSKHFVKIKMLHPPKTDAILHPYLPLPSKKITPI